MTEKVLHNLRWKVVSPSRYEHIGDNRAIVYKGRALGWAILIDDQPGSALFETRDDAMRVLLTAFTLYKMRKQGYMPTNAFCVALAADIIGPNWDQLGENARDKYDRLVRQAA